MKTLTVSRGIRISATAVALCSLADAAQGQPAPISPDAANRRPEYRILRAANPIKIDGKFGEPAWFAAPSLGDFVLPWWKEGRKEQTCAKILWDEEYLYLAIVCHDAHL